jgi:hypothetical protein
VASGDERAARAAARSISGSIVGIAGAVAW